MDPADVLTLGVTSSSSSALISSAGYEEGLNYADGTRRLWRVTAERTGWLMPRVEVQLVELQVRIISLKCTGFCR